MKTLKITDVRVLPGDSGFLIDDGKTSILYDTCFGFNGYQMAENIKKELGDRTLDYIFLTHSHYDHALGTPYILKYYPNAQVVAGEYAAKIFDRPSAKVIMRDLDRKYAETCGIQEYDDLVDNLHVDITVKDGDVITCGDMVFTVVNLPGHTKCSVGFYLAKNKFLLATETLGVYFGKKSYLPSYLVGFQMSLDSFRKARALEIDSILLPHYGVVDKEEAQTFLAESEEISIHMAQKIKKILSSGGTKDDAKAYFKEKIYTDVVQPFYPIDAFNLNTSILINLIEKELL